MKTEAIKISFSIEDEGTEQTTKVVLTLHGMIQDGSKRDFETVFSQRMHFNSDEFKEFREMIRDFYTKKEQEEHFAMMSQRDPEAPSYTMTEMMVDKGAV